MLSREHVDVPSCGEAYLYHCQLLSELSLAFENVQLRVGYCTAHAVIVFNMRIKEEARGDGCHASTYTSEADEQLYHTAGMGLLDDAAVTATDWLIEAALYQNQFVWWNVTMKPKLILGQMHAD